MSAPCAASSRATTCPMRRPPVITDDAIRKVIVRFGHAAPSTAGSRARTQRLMQGPRLSLGPSSWVPNHPTTERVRWLADIIIIAVLFVVGARLRLVFPFNAPGASWVWLPSGVALASLAPPRPQPLAGDCPWRTRDGDHGQSSADRLVLGPAYAAGEALLATWIIARGGRFDFGLGTVRDVLRFCLGRGHRRRRHGNCWRAGI